MDTKQNSGDIESGSRQLTFGVEEEFFIVDAQTGLSAPQYDAVAKAADSWINPCPEVTQSVVEIASEPHSSPELLRDELSNIRAGLDRAAEEVGCRILACGTHPYGNPSTDRITPTARYLHLENEYGFLLREVATCGMHVHVGGLTRDEIAFLMREARQHLSTLLAMSANSPFWRGMPSGMRSTRARVANMYPRNNLPPHLDSADHYDEIVASLIRSGAIREPKDIWWHLRPNEQHGTLEFRVFDVQSTCDDAVALAALTVALCMTLLDHGPFTPPLPEHLLEENMWSAARAGVEGAFAQADGSPLPTRSVAETLVAKCESAMVDIGAGNCIDTVRGLAICNGADQQLTRTLRGSTLQELVCGSEFARL